MVSDGKKKKKNARLIMASRRTDDDANIDKSHENNIVFFSPFKSILRIVEIFQGFCKKKKSSGSFQLK